MSGVLVQSAPHAVFGWVRVLLVVLAIVCLAPRVVEAQPATSKPAAKAENPSRPAAPRRTPAARMGTHFAEPSAAFLRAPVLQSIALPGIADATAIGGATGRDDAGRIFFGLTCDSDDDASARLLGFDFRNNRAVVLGDVVAELKRARIWRTGESQSEIQSKICAADDGSVYFASLDELGVKEDGSALPTWGGHLWSLRPSDGVWQHVLRNALSRFTMRPRQLAASSTPSVTSNTSSTSTTRTPNGAAR